ncbi:MULTISPECIES: helix-turn-helix domain-containing protein [unclassified Streptomyces]|uniref:helix-turn-helix domain-containing protein n=1 Tax=unclassified Streptomyces TaxID=2593676 RepID=UPI00166058DE|nr:MULTISPECIES: Scr1 family TA system antitoxin-like transcriptional regulator [unclassified Streptomyces]MBD0708589.1 transcriptional regulator [Streptomyces sp. CBMA291]MBD0713148.1 transcriptional regulator [Streptomyces sp. CBMA370]
MSTDFQYARVALGARLRELRTDRRLTGRQLAALLGWPQSKVSKLETGRQTATADDLRAWASGTGRPEAAPELVTRLRNLESRSRTWRRQLSAGHKPVQDALTAESERTRTFRVWEGAMIVGMLQTAEYARHVFTRYADLHQTVRDTEEAVQARVRRQEMLYAPGRTFHIVMGEAALRSLVCPPPVLAAQLDRLTGLLGLAGVSLGIVPFDAVLNLPPANGFWLHDDRLVIAEDWHAELWLDDADSVRLYRRVWQALADSAVYGADAHRVIVRARRALDVP